MECYICELEIDFDKVWFQMLVQEPGGHTQYGHLCSLSCLTDYVARVHAMELSDAD
jgi:hypothetical protein